MIRNAKIIGSIIGTLIAIYILYFVLEAEFIPCMIGTVAAILINTINGFINGILDWWEYLFPVMIMTLSNPWFYQKKKK